MNNILNGYNIDLLKKSPNEWQDFNLTSENESSKIILQESVILCDSLEKLLSIFSSFKKNKSKWIYRGLSDHEYSLKTSLDRFISESGYQNSITVLKRNYQETLDEFRKKIPDSYAFDIDKLNDFEWFALMQHYGAPTPLMDWTESIDIALYFSVHEYKIISDNEKFHCIWCLNQDQAMKKSIEIINSKIPEPNLDYKDNRFVKDRKTANLILENFTFENNCHGFVMPLLPFNKNLRQENQKGLFTINGNILVDFSYNFASMYRKDSSGSPLCLSNILKKIIIPQKLQLEALNYLTKSGIDAYSLAPDLNGYFLSFKQSFYKKN